MFFSLESKYNRILYLFQDDFRYLFTTNERLKSEYRSIQEEYKNLKSESSRLMLNNTEMQGEFNSQADTVASLQLENAKLLQKCDVSNVLLKTQGSIAFNLMFD